MSRFHSLATLLAIPLKIFERILTSMTHFEAPEFRIESVQLFIETPPRSECLRFNFAALSKNVTVWNKRSFVTRET